MGNRGGDDRGTGGGTGARWSIAELKDLIHAGLATVEPAIIPPALDQVLVGSVDRSRTPPVRAAFVAGFIDGEFPKACEEDPLLRDRERDAAPRAHGVGCGH